MTTPLIPSPFSADPHPLGEAGWSIYTLVKVRGADTRPRKRTPCGKYVPEFILKRIEGPFTTRAIALQKSHCYTWRVLVVLPHRGHLWGTDGAEEALPVELGGDAR